MVGTIDLEAHECWDFLRSSRVGRLAVMVEGCPDLFPINYAVDKGTVVFRTAPGRKLSAAIAGPCVAFEIDGFEASDDSAWSVVVKGRAEPIREVAELLATAEVPLFPWLESAGDKFVRIEPSIITGRKFARIGPSHWDTPLTGTRPQASE